MKPDLFAPLLAALLFVNTSLAWGGAIQGVVRLQGKAPEQPPVSMTSDQACVAMHAGSVPMGTFVVDAQGHLANVFVYIKTGLEGQTFDRPAQPADLDQKGCVYLPRVLGIVVGQDLRLLNSDGIMHNVHAEATANQSFNKAMPGSRKMMVVPGKVFAKPEVMVTFKCDVHPWMRSYLGVLPHPFFAVSGQDGSFALAQVPPGKYTVEAWHEELGTTTKEVVVGAGPVQLDFALSP